MGRDIMRHLWEPGSIVTLLERLVELTGTLIADAIRSSALTALACSLRVQKILRLILHPNRPIWSAGKAAWQR
jgi:hypothetical protein